MYSKNKNKTHGVEKIVKKTKSKRTNQKRYRANKNEDVAHNWSLITSFFEEKNKVIKKCPLKKSNLEKPLS